MRRSLLVALMGLGASVVIGSTAYAQACATSVSTLDGDVLYSGQICDDAPSLSSRVDAICGRNFLGLWTGPEVIFRWTVPETGRWDLSGSGAGLNALQWARDASLTCRQLSGLFPGTSLHCKTGNDKTFADEFLMEGEELVFVADSPQGTCGAGEVVAELKSSCRLSAQDLGSQVGQNIINAATDDARSTRVVRTTCGERSLPVWDRDQVEELPERIFRWVAPEDGSYNFHVASPGYGVTIATFEDGKCPTLTEANHTRCQTIDSGATTAVTRNITVPDMVEGQEIYVVVKQRRPRQPITFSLSITKDLCTPTETVSDMHIDSSGSNANVPMLPPGDTNHSFFCGDTNSETMHVLWEAPYAGTFTFTPQSPAGYAAARLEVRRGNCASPLEACVSDNETTNTFTLEKGEQLMLSIGRSSGISRDVRVLVDGVGCGDGIVQAEEACDYAADSSTFLCPTDYPLGTAACSQGCELDVRDCFGECPEEVSCEERAGTDTYCSGEGGCFYQCEDGWADCNGDLNAPQGEASDGCETDLRLPTSCGQCGQLCGDEQQCNPDPVEGFACDGEVTCYTDADGDGYGTGVGTPHIGNCPAGTSPFDGDCDDGNPSIHPDAPDICNGIDDNCDGNIDEVNEELCADIEGASGACVAQGVDSATCEFTCQTGYDAIGGDAMNGCKPAAQDGEPIDPGEEDKDEHAQEGIATGGGRVFNLCASAPLGAMSPLWLALLGLVVARRRQR